ncbi:MAG: hypothetical protein ACREVW_16595 [Burkholderiales bacterium]
MALQAPTASACGYCVEDKIAAVYDHAIVMQAFSQKHRVAFFGIDGPLVINDESLREIEALARQATGIDQGSVRVSLESAALSVAFDPRRTKFSVVQRSLEKKLAAKKLSLLPMRVMDGPAKLKAAGS